MKMLIFILMLVQHINGINSKLVMHENQLNTLTAELVIQNATLLEEKILETTCQWEKVKKLCETKLKVSNFR